MRFSDRRRLTDLAEKHCENNGMSITAFNIVSALDVLGFIHQLFDLGSQTPTCPNCGSKDYRIDVGDIICLKCDTHRR